MSGALPDSANASMVIGGRSGPSRYHRLCVASSVIVNTPFRRTPARSAFAFDCTTGGAERRAEAMGPELASAMIPTNERAGRTRTRTSSRLTRFLGRIRRNYFDTLCVNVCSVRRGPLRAKKAPRIDKTRRGFELEMRLDRVELPTSRLAGPQRHFKSPAPCRFSERQKPDPPIFVSFPCRTLDIQRAHERAQAYFTQLHSLPSDGRQEEAPVSPP